MVKAAEILASHRTRAEETLRRGGVGEVDFSGATYQVQVFDSEEEEFWPFLQFDNLGSLQDYFCPCHQVEEGAGCHHLAAALLYIFRNEELPLHERFEYSLWNSLGRIFGERQGYDSSLLRRDKRGGYVCYSVTNKRLFSVIGRNERSAARLEFLIERRIPETEENSLKFSGLSQEEIAGWREGRPSDRLQYELSFWADLAKWLFFLQDQGASYRIEFGYSSTRLPNEIRIAFEEIEIVYYLSEANLPLLIPSLTTVDSPLKVHDFQDAAIERITYDRPTGVLSIEAKPQAAIQRGLEEEERLCGKADHVIPMDEWLFIPEDGFYSREQHTLLRSPQVSPAQLGPLLTDHARTIARHLVGEQIHLTPVRPSYHLSFDGECNLRIVLFLFEAGDLSLTSSRQFGEWVYLEDDGFYKLEEPLFRCIETVIPEEEVSNFVHSYRSWLSEIPGFHPHIAVVEAQLLYSVSADQELLFTSRLDIGEGRSGAMDFGDWVYVAGEGFFAKPVIGKGVPIRAGLTIGRREIPFFIKANRDDLELVEGFFAQHCPVKSVSLAIDLKGDQVIIAPEYRLMPGYRAADLTHFDEFVYVAGKGFYELPRDLRLPERFRTPATLKGKELELFLSYELNELRPLVDSIDPRLDAPEALTLVVDGAAYGEGAHASVLALDLHFESDKGRVSVAELWKAQQKGERYLFSKAGLLDLTDRRFQWLRQVPPARIDRANGAIRLTALEFIRLSVTEKIESRGDKKGEEARHLLESFASFTAPEQPNLEGLQSQLRHYQRLGVRWLWFLYHYGLSGLLCDDMGLGKTHQAMALLSAVSNCFSKREAEEQPYYLVVCPTSVIYHWKEKLSLFLPGLRILTYYGPGRSLDNLEQFDVILTSYGTLRQDRLRLSRISFEVAIYDEIQVAKNQSSQTYRALDSMQAHMRLGLTGTPIENSLRELKALFDLVLPTYLPNDARFRDEFAIPIERDGDRERKQLLRRIVHPFILRRKKEEVLTELPDKSEETMHCDLRPGQRELYFETLNRSRAQILTDLQKEGEAIPYLHIFALLTQLKQICDHPAVMLKEPQEYAQYDSGKWRLFVELLSQARESSQKVVVFSQYLGMLDIIESYLRESQIGYAAIRGKTVKREEELRRFNEDPACEVFVGSLQAAGLGIDLTAGSVVIHYDRWWNAARENQATDRVYRIGQTRGVQVFKFLTVGTIEERIDELIEQKGALMEEVIGTDDHRQLKLFSREELIAILAGDQS
jgi:superfamily II DNA or RNA helicase